MKPKKSRLRMVAVAACEIFALLTLIKMLPTGQPSRILMALATLALVLLPPMAERLLRCRFHPAMYYFCLAYALGPMVGTCYDLYYMGIGFDKLLHTAGGVVFALFGLCLFDLLGGPRQNVWLKALFAFCFSLALSVLWEFAEYFGDCIFHTDMQQDALLPAISSYFLGNGPGVAGRLENIGTVTVDGVTLVTGGYLDIGLTDTMQDMLVETLGALIACAAYVLDGGRHEPIKITERSKPRA